MRSCGWAHPDAVTFLVRPRSLVGLCPPGAHPAVNAGRCVAGGYVLARRTQCAFFDRAQSADIRSGLTRDAVALLVACGCISICAVPAPRAQPTRDASCCCTFNHVPAGLADPTLIRCASSSCEVFAGHTRDASYCCTFNHVLAGTACRTILLCLSLLISAGVASSALATASTGRFTAHRAPNARRLTLARLGTATVAVGTGAAAGR